MSAQPSAGRYDVKRMDKPDNSLVGKALGAGRALKRFVGGESVSQGLYRRLTGISERANAARDRGDLDGALAGFRQALDLANHMSRSFCDDEWSCRVLSWAYDNLGGIQFKLGHLDAAREAQFEAVRFARKGIETPGEEAAKAKAAAWVLCHLGDIEVARKADDGAFEAFSEAVRLWRRMVGLPASDSESLYGLGFALYCLGSTAARQRRFAVASTSLEEAVECAQAVADSATDEVDALDLLSWCLCALGDVQRELGVPAGAAVTFSRAVEVGKSLAALTDDALPSLDRWFAALTRLGDAWDDCSDADAALEARRQASDIARRRVEPAGGSVAALEGLGGSLFALGLAASGHETVEEAVSALRECVSVQKQILELDAPQAYRQQFLAAALYSLCHAEVDAGRLGAARDAVEEALLILRGPIKDSEPGEVASGLSSALRAFARLEEAAGRPDLARKAYEEAITRDLEVVESRGGRFGPASDLASSHLNLSDLELEAGRREAARDNWKKGSGFILRVIDEVGEDWFCLNYPLSLLDGIGNRLLAAGDREAALEVRNDWVELHRRIARHDAASEETLERLASALRELVIELELVGSASEACARRDELALVEARLRRARAASRPADPVPA